MVPPSLFHSRSFTGANLVTLLFYMALTGSLFFLPFLMMQVHGYSAFVAGSVFLPFVAMALLIGRLSGRICARFGAKVPLIVASLAVAAGLLLFALLVRTMALTGPRSSPRWSFRASGWHWR